MATSVSPSRHVLGWKTTNAFIQQWGPAKNNNPMTVTQAPTFEQLRKNFVAFPNEGSPKIGQKRSIAQVDGTEEHTQSPIKQSEPPAITKLEDDIDTPVKEEVDSEAEDESVIGRVTKEEDDIDDETKPSASKSNATTSTLLSSFHASQEVPVPIEEQFIIQDETSQKTLENLNMTPLPQNASQPQILPNPNSLTKGSQDSMRMSSFVDFDAADAEEEDLKMILPKPTLLLSDPARKAMIDKKAETLRTRLQLAAYKIKTNQAKTPFLWLRSAGALREQLKAPPIKYEEDVVWAARTQATDQEKPVVRNLNSLPMPRIVPTAYSARYIVPPKKEVSSSPPLSTDSEELCTSRAETLTPKNYAQLRRTPVQLGSPRESEADGTSLLGRQSHGDVPSSVVKTEAANGLLELIRAAAES